MVECCAELWKITNSFSENKTKSILLFCYLMRCKSGANPPPWCTIAQHTKRTHSQLWWQLPCARINHRIERGGLRSPFSEVHLNGWNSNALKPWNTWCDNEGNSWRYGSSLWCCLEHLVSCDEAPILQTQQKWIERFSNDCCKTNTEAITPTNHNSSKQQDAPIRIPSNYLQLAQSAGKIAPARCHWFWLSFSLVEKTCARSLSRSLRVAITTA